MRDRLDRYMARIMRSSAYQAASRSDRAGMRRFGYLTAIVLILIIIGIIIILTARTGGSR